MGALCACGSADGAAADADFDLVAAQKSRTKLVIRTIGLARARAKLALAKIAYTMSRLAWLGRRPTPA